MHRDPPSRNPPGPTAVELCKIVRLSDEARPLLRTSMLPREFVEVLIGAREHHTAIRVLAQALPKRAAVWWGAQCLWQLCRPMPTLPQDGVLTAAVNWVLEPSAANRHVAEEAAEAAGRTTASGCLALAVRWSDGSMVGPELPSVPPPPHLCGQMVAGSLLMMEGEFATSFTRDTYPQILAQGSGDCRRPKPLGTRRCCRGAGPCLRGGRWRILRGC